MKMVWGKRILRVLRDELGIGIIPWRIKLVHGLMALLPYQAARRIRTLLYRCAGMSIGSHTLLYGKMMLTGGSKSYKNLHIGDFCRINTPCRIGLSGTVTLGNYVVFGHNVNIITETHDMSAGECRAGRLKSEDVVICDGVWVAANVTILPGVTIGAGAVVGAGSVVTRNVPAHTLVAGNPARFVRMLHSDADQEFVFSHGIKNAKSEGTTLTLVDATRH